MNEPGPSPALVADVFARDCTSRSAFEDVTARWASLTLLALHEGGYRFNALRRRVDGVSEKMLSQTLQALERDGMVIREVVTAIPPRGGVRAHASAHASRPRCASWPTCWSRRWARSRRRGTPTRAGQA